MGSRFRAYCILSFFSAIAAIGSSPSLPAPPLPPVSGCKILTGRYPPHGQNTAHAIHVRRQFYNVIIHLATSKISVTLLGNAGLVLVLLIAQVTPPLPPHDPSRNHPPRPRHALSLPRSSSSSSSSYFACSSFALRYSRKSRHGKLMPVPNRQVLRHVFLGPLRAAEMDRLYEKR